MAILFENREPLYVGATIALREYNGYDDSDFYAIVWDNAEARLHMIEYATTRYGGNGTATVDCTQENLRKAYQYSYSHCRKHVFNDYVNSLKTPEKGDLVTVISGRKVKKGTTGRLFWIGTPQTFGYGNTSTKVGIALDDSRGADGRYANVAWTYLHNVEAVVAPKFSLAEAKYHLRCLRDNPIGYWRLHSKRR